jgi:Holliday junction resolvase RusA-like endonuclease
LGEAAKEQSIVIEIVIPNIVPPTTTHQSKKIVKAGKFTKLADSDALNKAKDFWTQLLIPFKTLSPIECPVSLVIEIAWPYRASEPKKNQAARMKHTSKPDCSNMAKTIEDRLVELGFIKDDAQVCELIVRKFWDKTGYTNIRIIERSAA